MGINAEKKKKSRVNSPYVTCDGKQCVTKQILKNYRNYKKRALPISFNITSFNVKNNE